MTSTEISVERYPLPPVPDPHAGDDPIESWQAYARVQAGEIVAEVIRFCYWHPSDGGPLDVEFEARINGLEGRPAPADVYADKPLQLFDLAQVAFEAALLLVELAGTRSP